MSDLLFINFLAAYFAMTKRHRLVLIVAMLIGASSVCGIPISLAQTTQLSSEQQRMLDQLPPAQRQQALRAIRDMQNVTDAEPASTLQESLSPLAQPESPLESVSR